MNYLLTSVLHGLGSLVFSWWWTIYDIVQFSSVVQLYPTLCNPMNLRTPGLPVLHLQSLLQFMSIELVMLSNHLILCHPLLILPSIFPSIRWPKYWSFSQLHWAGSLHQVAKVLRVSASASVLPMTIQGWFPLGLTGLISLLSKGLSRVFSSTTVQKYQFFGAQALWSNFHIHTWLLESHSFDYMDLCWRSDVSAFNTMSRFVTAFLSHFSLK